MRPDRDDATTGQVMTGDRLGSGFFRLFGFGLGSGSGDGEKNGSK